jgi:hypothetical protein
MNDSDNSSVRETPPEYGGGPLDLPDWSGHQSHPSRMSKDAWLEYCRSNLPKLRQRPGHHEIRRQNGIASGFVL